jgi:hypothetical protein
MLGDLLDIYIFVDMDPEKFPNVQDELSDLSRFLADVDSNALIPIFFVLF